MPPLATVQGLLKLNGYVPLSEAQWGIKAALVNYVNADPQPANEECVSGLREDLPASVLFSEGALAGPHTLHRVLRD